MRRDAYRVIGVGGTHSYGGGIDRGVTRARYSATTTWVIPRASVRLTRASASATLMAVVQMVEAAIPRARMSDAVPWDHSIWERVLQIISIGIPMEVTSRYD